MLAGEVKFLVGPGAQDDLDGLAEARRTFLGRHPKSGELDPCEAAARAPVDAAARQYVEQRHLLGEAQGMIEWGERHCGADAQPLRPGGAKVPTICTEGHTLKLLK